MMDSFTVDRILKLNSDFYQSVAEDFSNSRKEPWEEWEISLKYLPQNFWKKEKVVLDLGCGNGRFCGFLLSKLNNVSFKYYGVDNSENILDIAKKKYSNLSNFTFDHKDIISKIDELNISADLVVAFGLTHHIPSKNLREKWFNNLTKLVNNNGVIILTFWNFDPLKAVEQREITQLEEGDYFRGWKHSNKKLRYVHVYSDFELQQVINTMKKNGLEIYNEFISGKTPASSNRTLIFRKL